MPPRRRQSLCDRVGCCVIWYGSGGVINHGCAHCPKVFDKHAEPDEALLERQVAQSRQGHADKCQRRRRR